MYVLNHTISKYSYFQFQVNCALNVSINWKWQKLDCTDVPYIHQPLQSNSIIPINGYKTHCQVSSLLSSPRWPWNLQSSSSSPPAWWPLCLGPHVAASPASWSQAPATRPPASTAGEPAPVGSAVAGPMEGFPADVELATVSRTGWILVASTFEYSDFTGLVRKSFKSS